MYFCKILFKARIDRDLCWPSSASPLRWKILVPCSALGSRGPQDRNLLFRKHPFLVACNNDERQQNWKGFYRVWKGGIWTACFSSGQWILSCRQGWCEQISNQRELKGAELILKEFSTDHHIRIIETKDGFVWFQLISSRWFCGVYVFAVFTVLVKQLTWQWRLRDSSFLVSRLQRRIFLCCGWVKITLFDPKFHVLFSTATVVWLSEKLPKKLPKKGYLYNFKFFFSQILGSTNIVNQCTKAYFQNF